MAEVTYYVGLPFIVTDDRVAAGEPTECFNPNAASRDKMLRWKGKRIKRVESPKQRKPLPLPF